MCTRRAFLLHIVICGFLTNELRVTSYKLQVTACCKRYELPLTYELQVSIYCASSELLLTYELQVSIYCTSYKLLLTCQYELLFISRVTSCFLHTSITSY